MGMGNAKLPSTDGNNRVHGNRVEVSLLKNNVDQLASATTPSNPMTTAQPSYNSNSNSSYSQPAAQNTNTGTNNASPQQ